MAEEFWGWDHMPEDFAEVHEAFVVDDIGCFQDDEARENFT